MSYIGADSIDGSLPESQKDSKKFKFKKNRTKSNADRVRRVSIKDEKLKSKKPKKGIKNKKSFNTLSVNDVKKVEDSAHLDFSFSSM